MNEDRDYWSNLSWPAAPNQEDYEMYESLIEHPRVLLLGSTKLLLPLCTEAWDQNPLYDDPKIITRDWLTLDTHFDTIISDGGAFNFTEELGLQVFDLCRNNCRRLIARVFYQPSWQPKYARWFPNPEDFPVKPTLEIKDHMPIYRFYVWDFR